LDSELLRVELLGDDIDCPTRIIESGADVCRYQLQSGKIPERCCDLQMIAPEHIFAGSQRSPIQRLGIGKAVRHLPVSIGERDLGRGDYGMSVAICLLDHVERAPGIGFGLR
jgi:hypothetical protein